MTPLTIRTTAALVAAGLMAVGWATGQPWLAMVAVLVVAVAVAILAARSRSGRGFTARASDGVHDREP